MDWAKMIIAVPIILLPWGILLVAWLWRTVGRRRTEAKPTWTRLDDPTFGEMHHIPGEAVRTMHRAGIGCCPLGQATNGAPSSAPRRSPGRANGRSR